MRQVKFGRLFLITLVQNFAVDLLPARSAAIFFYSYFTSGEGLKVSWSLAGYGLTILFDALLMLIILAALFPFAGLLHIQAAGLFPFFILFFAFLLAFFIWTENLLSLFLRILQYLKIKKFGAFFEEIVSYLKKISLADKCNLLLLSLFIRILKYLGLFVLFSAFSGSGWSLGNFAVLTFAIAAAELSALLPVQGLAGFGTWEGAFKLAVTVMALPISDPFAIAFLLHLTTQLWEYSLGIFILTVLMLNRQKKADSFTAKNN